MNKGCVVVTGASAGVGRSTALAFARRGWPVGLIARGAKGLEAARSEIEALGGKALPIVADVAEHAQVDAAAERIERELGPIAVWVNNAMATIFCPLEKITPEDFERATRVTYLGAVWGTMAALRRMKPRNAGVIVQVGSALAYRSIPLQSPYCGAKSALRGFTDSLRSELIHDRSKVRLTMVQLCAFNTPQFEWGRNCMPGRPQPVPPIFQPELAADAIVWAATHERRELWVGSPTVKAIIGNRLFPGFADSLLATRAWEGQMTSEALPPERRDNLYHPVEEDRGAHGRFDDRARRHSWHYVFTTHRAAVAAAALALGAAGALLIRAGQRRVPARAAP